LEETPAARLRRFYAAPTRSTNGADSASTQEPPAVQHSGPPAPYHACAGMVAALL